MFAGTLGTSRGLASNESSAPGVRPESNAS